MMWLLAASLLLQPVMDAPADVRMVATGTDAPIEWHLDGRRIAVTNDSEPFVFPLPAGPHQLWVVTASEESWSAMVRPDPDSDGFEPVIAWSAHHPGRGSSEPVLPWLVGGLGAVVLLAPRRPKRP